jgi:phosphomannomutase
MPEPIISVSGLRGIVGESLTPEIAVRYAAAFASTLPPGPIVLTYDGRESGMMFMYAIMKNFVSTSRDVIDGGCQATPTTGVMVRHYRAVGGIQISASHNPIEYNGLKLFSADGRVVPATVGSEVSSRYEREEFAPTKRNERGEFILGQTGDGDFRLHNPHLELVLSIVNVERIKSKSFHAVLDSNAGSGFWLAGSLLTLLNCPPYVTEYERLGVFVHPPEPTAENLVSVLPSIVETKSDIGFCQDPDADRLAVIDENGRYLGEEYTLAICVNHVLSQTRGPVVTNCSTSRMTEDLAKKYHVPFFRSAVGEANVVDAMLAHNAVIGGEGNGGVIDPRVVLVRDSFTAMALILDAMAARNLPVSALADELPRYEICKTKISFPREKLSAGYAALERHFKDAQPDRLSVHVRPEGLDLGQAIANPSIILRVPLQRFHPQIDLRPCKRGTIAADHIRSLGRRE